MKIKHSRWLLIVVLIMLISGCGGMKPQQVKPLQLGTEALVDQTKADNAKKITLAMEEVLEVKGVTLEDKIYVAPHVKHAARLRLEKIRREGFEHIKKRYPDETVFFSTDKKIYMELEKLESALKKRTITEKQLEKQLKKLEDDMKG